MSESRPWRDELKDLAVEHHRVMGDLLPEIFPPDFLGEHFSLGSFTRFCSEVPWPIKNEEDIRDVPVNVLDRTVRCRSEFDSWDEFWRTAVKRWENGR